MISIKKTISTLKAKLFTKKNGNNNKKVKKIVCECGNNLKCTKNTEHEGRIYNDYECECGKIYRKLDKNVIYI